MTKLAIASLALAVAGVGALAAVGVTRISNGQCPLTGRQIHCNAAPGAEQSQPSLAADAVAAPQTGVAADAIECPVSHATLAGSTGQAACPGGRCVPDCAENPPPQCRKRQCEQKAQCDAETKEKKAPVENP
jgi:hypothetical protein